MKTLTFLILLVCTANVFAQDQAAIEAYTKYQEWHFELRFTPEQRTKYQELLARDYNRGNLAADVDSAPKIVESSKKSDWMTLFKAHSDQKKVDDIESSTQAMMNPNNIYGNGIRAQTRREAQKGFASSAFLLRTVEAYEKPLVGDGNIYTSLFPRQVDAAFEWTAFRIVAVTGKQIEAGEDARRQMRERIIKTWKDAGDKNKLANFKGWLDLNVNNWLIWRLGDYSFYTRLSPYQKKEQLLEWAQEIVGIAPETKPYLEQRLKEYKDYVAKMPNSEIKAEFERKKQTDAKFQTEMARMQGEMRSTQQTFAQMRQSLLSFHVANMNIAENIGNTGYVWVIK